MIMERVIMYSRGQGGNDLWERRNKQEETMHHLPGIAFNMDAPSGGVLPGSHWKDFSNDCVETQSGHTSARKLEGPHFENTENEGK